MPTSFYFIRTASFFISVLLAFTAFGQGVFSVNGQVLDSLNQPVDGVIIQVLNGSDSTLAKTGLSESDGRFSIGLSKEGNYFVMTTALGFQVFTSDRFTLNNDIPVFSIPSFQLKSISGQLAEVSIQAQRLFAEKKIDRVTINPDAMISNAGVTALEVLEKAPGVQVDLNGNISLHGKQGVIVMIDDKPTYLGPAELANYLKSIPSSSIGTIDIMTNPPAQYDAAGNVGVINIKIKKNRAEGLNGGINLSYGQGFYHRTNNSVNLNYRINKINVFTNLSYNENNSYQDLTINRNYFDDDRTLTSEFVQQTFIKMQNHSATGRLGLDYYINDKHTIGVIGSGFYTKSITNTSNLATVEDGNNNLQNTVLAISPSDRDFVNGSGNINYAFVMDSLGQQLSVNLDYSQYDSQLDQSLLSYTYSPTDSLLGRTNLVSNLPSDIQIATAKVDYTKPFASGGRFEGGAKTSYIKTNNIANFYDENNGVLTTNFDFTNQFEYTERIQAAYLNYSKDFKRFSVQTGLRYENTEIDGYQYGNEIKSDSSFSRTYNNLFPTVYLMYQADTLGKHTLGFSYGRRIDRPNYQDMNPFTYPLDRFTLYSGNPFLQPTFSHNFELSHTYAGKLTTTLLYSYIDNVISETIEQNTAIFYSRPGNIGKQISSGISVNGAFNINKWWVLQIYSEVMYQQYTATLYGQNLDNRGTYWYIGPTNQFILSPKWNLEVGGTYQTSVVLGQFLTIPVGSVRAAVAMKCLKNQGSLKLVVNDVFFTNQPGGDIRSLYNSTANWYSVLDTRVVTVAFGYRFNKGQSRALRTVGGSDNEKSRVK